jgi:hypothetical protein
MADSCIVAIAAPKYLDTIKQRLKPEGDVLVFEDAQAIAALDAVVQHRPGVVVLERLFAATSRGAALINRIKADHSLDMVEIRVQSPDGSYSRISPRRVAPPPPQLDWRGTRRAMRFRMNDGTRARINLLSGTVVDLSTIGVQVAVPAALKPGESVDVTLADESGASKCSGLVAWASFVITGYRAGIEFTDPPTEDLNAFIIRHKARENQ